MGDDGGSGWEHSGERWGTGVKGGERGPPMAALLFANKVVVNGFVDVT